MLDLSIKDQKSSHRVQVELRATFMGKFTSLFDGFILKNLLELIGRK